MNMTNIGITAHHFMKWYLAYESSY